MGKSREIEDLGSARELEEQIDDLDDRREDIEKELEEVDEERHDAIESMEAGNEEAIERVKNAQREYDTIERELEEINQEREALAARLRETQATEESEDPLEKLEALAREAAKARNQLFEELQEADEEMVEIVNALKQSETRWKRAVQEFKEEFYKIAPGLNEVQLMRAEEAGDEERIEKLKKERDEVLRELKNREVDVTAALDQSYAGRSVTRTYKNPWPETRYGWMFSKAISVEQS